MKMACVVDASIVLAWILPDEQTNAALNLRQEVIQSPTFAMITPPIFWSEVVNVLWVAVKRERISTDLARDALTTLQDFKFDTWLIEPAPLLNHALEHDLSAYDSSYLMIAKDLQIPLWTLDKKLHHAARNWGVSVKP